MATQTWNQVGSLIAGAAFTTAPPFNFLETRPPQAAVATTFEVATAYPGSPFVIDTGEGVFSGVIDPLMVWGYNVDGGGARLNLLDAAAYWMIEAKYKNVDEFMETHFDVTSTAGVERRLLGFTVDRDDPDNYAASALAVSALQAFSITKTSDGSALFTFGGGGTLTLSQNAAQLIFAGTIAQIQAVTGPLYLTAGGGVQISGAVGFNGTSPLAAPVLATGALHTVDDVIAMLQAYGLCTQT